MGVPVLRMAFAICVVVLYLVTPGNTAAQTLEIEVAFPALSFNNPVDLQEPGDGTNRLFVVEQLSGRIYVFDNDEAETTASLFLDLGSKILAGGEQGLLGLAFHPDFSQNGYFFVNYTASSPRRTVVERYWVDASTPNAAVADSARLIIEVNQTASNHNAGQLAFGPDGMLYIALGDGGGSPPVSQDLSELLGSMLRIDVNGVTDNSPDYYIPSDNPLVGNTDGFREEAWAWGFRNPWRFSFDDAGQLWLGDVGDGSWEEVNIVERNKNYGWPIMEATHCHSPPTNCTQTGLELPVAEYSHTLGRSITGGYVYQGARAPQLVGKYLFADYVDGRIWSLTDTGSGYTTEPLFDLSFNISSFGQDASGEVFVVGYNGTIYRFKSASTGRDGVPAVNVVSVDGPFPNPVAAGRRLTLRLDGAERRDLMVRIYDVVGRQVGALPIRAASSDIEIPLPRALKSGAYWIRIDGDTFSLVRGFALVQ